MNDDSLREAIMNDARLQQGEILDTRGLYCPEPIMLMHNKVRDMATGDILEVLATDPATTRDIPKFCSFLGHRLVDQSQDGDEYRYRIQLG